MVNKDILEGLNDAQKKAVLSKDAAVLVSGPAHSGKTEVLVRKIQHLLHDGTAKPGEILFFTEQEEELKARLAPFLKDGYAEAWFTSFSAFGKKLLRRHYEEAGGIYPNFHVLDGLEEKLVLRKIIGDLKLPYYEEVKHSAGFLDEIVDFIDLVKLNGSAPLLSLKNAKFASLKKIYCSYEQYLSQQNRLDFRDLILKTLRLFGDNPSLCEEYRKKFACILLDDFQNIDLNEYRLFSMLGAGAKQVMASGNEDEGVFRFRGGASSAVRQKFVDEFEPVLISLPERPCSPETAIVRCDTSGEEALFIARRISALVKEKYRCGDIVVLCRGFSREIRNLEDAMKIYCLDYSVTGGIAFFKQPEIIRVIAILRLIWGGEKDEGSEGESDSHLLEALSSPGLDMDYVDIQRIAAYASRFRIPLMEAVRDTANRKKNARFSDIDPRRALKEETRETLRSFLARLEKLRKDSGTLPLEKFIYGVLLEFGYLESGRDDRKIAGNLSHFLEIVKKFERIDNNVSFADFMKCLDEILVSYGREESVRFTPSADTVRIMTVQHARGCFFPVVFVTGLTEGRFPRDMANSSLLTFEERKTLKLFPLRDIEEHLAEEQRIFDLALSRALEKRILTCSRTAEGKDSPPVSSFLLRMLGAEKESEIPRLCKKEKIDFIDRTSVLGMEEGEGGEILTPDDLVNEWIKTENTSMEEILKTMYREKYELIVRIKEKFSQKDLCDRVVIGDDFSFSAYKLASFASCPAKFFFSSLVRIFLPPSSPLVFGLLTHRILAQFHKKYEHAKFLSSPSAAGDLKKEIALSFSENAWMFDTLFERDVYKDLTERILLRYLDTEKEEGDYSVESVEKEFTWKMDDAVFKGRLDRLDRLDGTYRLIDYKTARSNQHMAYALCVRMADGRNFQMPLYFFAVSEGMKKKVGRLAVYWLRKEKAGIKAELEIGGEYKAGGKVVSCGEALEQSRKNIKETVDGIRKGYYPQESEDCRNCAFEFLCDR